MDTNLLYNNKFQQDIDWSVIEEQICSNCRFLETLVQFRNDKTKYSTNSINNYYNLIEFILEKFDYYNDTINDSLSLIQTNDPDSLTFKKLKKKNLLTLQEINSIVISLELYKFSVNHLQENIKVFSYNIPEEFLHAFNSKISKTLRSFVSEEGEVNFKKHPKLKTIYNKIEKLEDVIKENIKAIFTDNKIKKVIQINQYDIFNDHFVIPIKSDSYSTQFGRILGRSNSGATLLVEPSKIKSLNSERLEKILELDKEIFKIQKDYCDYIFENIKFIQPLRHFILELDLLLGKTRFINEFGLTRPNFCEEEKIQLKEFFNPLIDEPIKNDLLFQKEKQTLVISGPNAGGKTVFLKTIGLIYIFIKKRMFIPVSHAEIKDFSSIFYIGNDNQNIIEGTSSFTSEAKFILKTIESLDESNLIIIDEIFNSTSSDEASALSMGILEYLHENNFPDTKVIFSTHHHDLKIKTNKLDYIVSAHMAFEPKTFRPLYKLILDGPGPSNAIETISKISSNSSILNDIVSKSRSHISKIKVAYEDEINKYSKLSSELEKTIEENNKLKADLEKKKHNFENEIEFIKNNRIKEEKAILRTKIKKTQALIDTIKKSSNIQNKKQIQKELDTIKINDEIKYDINKQSQIDYIIGKQYMCSILNDKCKLEQIDKKKKLAKVTYRGKYMSLPLNTLFETKQSKQEIKVSFSKSNSSSVEIDCRGLRREDFLSLAETSILNLINGDIPFLRVIHGHGDGILKKSLRDILQNYSDLDWGPDEGNDGSTLIKLK